MNRTLSIKRDVHKQAEQVRRNQLRDSMARLATLVAEECCAPARAPTASHTDLDASEALDSPGAGPGTHESPTTIVNTIESAIRQITCLRGMSRENWRTMGKRKEKDGRGTRTWDSESRRGTPSSSPSLWQ